MTEKLSEHFTREEFEYSNTAKRLGIVNKMDSKSLSNAKHTCTYMLEPLRKELASIYGVKVYININSGYRCVALNKSIKGSSTSQHCKGLAVDCYFYTVSNGKKTILDYDLIYRTIKGLVKSNKLSVDQVIDEHSGNSRWIHLSCREQLADNRKQFLRYNGTSYWLDLK